jgi:hypothetical protein
MTDMFAKDFTRGSQGHYIVRYGQQIVLVAMTWV